MLNASIVPETYKDKDPRTLLYHFPNMPIVVYAKKMQKFVFYKALEVAEDMAHKQGFLLVPSSCFHWKRIKDLGEMERKVKVGRNSFFFIKDHEMSKTEMKKFHLYLYDVQNIKH